jgi:hypothetical protein
MCFPMLGRVWLLPRVSFRWRKRHPAHRVQVSGVWSDSDALVCVGLDLRLVFSMLLPLAFRYSLRLVLWTCYCTRSQSLRSFNKNDSTHFNCRTRNENVTAPILSSTFFSGRLPSSQSFRLTFHDVHPRLRLSVTIDRSPLIACNAKSLDCRMASLVLGDSSECRGLVAGISFKVGQQS